MSILIVKLNAIGDVIRTTSLLSALPRGVTWVTEDASSEVLRPLENVRCITWSARNQALDRHYDLVINLEDDVTVAQFAREASHSRLFGADLDDNGALTYSDHARAWFDLSLISIHGQQRADELKFLNRHTYQELIFGGLGYNFSGQRYVLPEPAATTLAGDVAIAPLAGPVWPMKAWAYYDELKVELEASGLQVNFLPRRNSLLEHMGDVSNHRCLVSGDSLPMHFALATGTPCVTLFNCTSPWEIYDYGVQSKLVSPLLERFFYKRHFDRAAITAIRLDEVFDAVMERLRYPAAVGK